MKLNVYNLLMLGKAPTKDKKPKKMSDVNRIVFIALICDTTALFILFIIGRVDLRIMLTRSSKVKIKRKKWTKVPL